MERLNVNFNNFVSSIGEIPTSYLESLTYEEQLLWFCKNLTDVINNMEYAIGVEDYETLVENLNSFDKDSYNIGQSFKVETLNCPDLWISSIEDTKVEYQYTTDEALINVLKTDGVIQIGYFKLMSLECLLDLSNYVTIEELNNTLIDYVTSSELNTILSSYVTAQSLITTLQDYELLSNKVTSLSSSSTDSEYPSAKCAYDSLALKENLSNKVTSISSSSTDSEYPSAKCVYDIVGDVESLLGAI